MTAFAGLVARFPFLKGTHDLQRRTSCIEAPMMHDQKPPRQPLFWATTVFSLGLWMGERAWRPPAWWVVAVVTFVFAAAWWMRRRAGLAKTLSLAVWFVLGAFLIQVRSQPWSDPHLLALADGRPVMLTARVLREGYARASGPGSIRQVIDVETEQIAGQGTSWPLRAGVRLSIYQKGRTLEHPAESGAAGIADDAILSLTYGARLRILAKLHPARNYRNPGAFDYEGYLRDNSIAVLGSAEASDIERLPGFSGSRIQLWRNRAHASIIAKIHQLWPESQASLMDAMVLGEESFLRSATRTEYQRSGTYHVLVVSGMNLSILAFAIFLGSTTISHRSRGGGNYHGRGFVRLCIHCGGRSSGVARRADADDISGGAPAVSRTQHDECHRSGGTGNSDRRSARVVWREFSTDISCGLYHCGDRCSNSGTDKLALCPRAAAVASGQL